MLLRIGWGCLQNLKKLRGLKFWLLRCYLLYSLKYASVFSGRGLPNTGNCQIVSMPLSLLEKGNENVRWAAYIQGSSRGLRSMGSGFLILDLPNSSLNLGLLVS